jgi:hypothetical protein
LVKSGKTPAEAQAILKVRNTAAILGCRQGLQHWQQQYSAAPGIMNDLRRYAAVGLLS